MFFQTNASLLLVGLILLIAGIDDLWSRKIHNKLILLMIPFVIAFVFFLEGRNAVFSGALSTSIALLLGIPLTLGRVMGGGDLKLLAVMAFPLSWPEFLKIFIYSLPWALLLGLIKIILDGKLKEFFFNMFFLFKYRNPKNLEFHSIPYSIALFMAWLSFLSLQNLI